MCGFKFRSIVNKNKAIIVTEFVEECVVTFIQFNQALGRMKKNIFILYKFCQN